MKFLASACFLVALVSAGCAEMDQPVETADSTRTTLQAYTVDSETGVMYGVEMTYNTIAIDRADAQLLLGDIRVEHDAGLTVAGATPVIVVDASSLSASEIGFDEIAMDMTLEVSLAEWTQRIDDSRWADLAPENDSELPPIIEFCPPGH